MPRPLPRFRTVELGGRSFQALDLDHPELVARITEEMRAGLDVYYDRRWRLTRAFCAYLMAHPELVGGRSVLVAGAGVGMEAVVVGALSGRPLVNDVAPVSLELAAEQLTANGLRDFEIRGGPMEHVDLEGVDLIVACLVVYDRETRDSMIRLVSRTGERGIPALLANAEIGPFFAEVLEAARAPVVGLAEWEHGRVVRLG